MKVWTAPQVTVVGKTEFYEPQHLPVRWEDNSGCPSDGERLVEYAGRLCYMSQLNPGKKDTKKYIAHILEMGHGSVLEHLSISLLVEGVSRSLTHELIRHRAGTAVSQLSQRYVEGEIEVVAPPVVAQEPPLLEEWTFRAKSAVLLYRQQLEGLRRAGLAGKPMREAARSLLPNCTETKLVFTGNIRAWRHIVEARSDQGADAEMRRFALAVLDVLHLEAPNCFQDFSLAQLGKPKHSKV